MCGFQSSAAVVDYGATQTYNQILQYGYGLAGAAAANGTISYGFRSTILNGLFDTQEELSSLSETLSSDAVVGDAGLVALDVLLANALAAEYESVKNGTWIPEGVALRLIIFGQ